MLSTMESQATECLDDNQIGMLRTGLHTLGIEDDQVDLIGQLLIRVNEMAKNRPAEMEVIEREPLPALLSDSEFTFGAGSQVKTVQLKILSGEFYLGHLLPYIEEWTTALYREDALSVLKEASPNPVRFIVQLCHAVLKRPKNDRIKQSFYDFASFTFSTPEVEISPEFFRICPPDQQMGAIMKLVETNRANFTNWWAGAPTLLKHELTLLYMTLIQSIQNLNQSVISTMQQMTKGFQPFLLNGGPENTGPDGSGEWPEESPESTAIF